VHEQLNRKIDKLYTESNLNPDDDALQKIKQVILNSLNSLNLSSVNNHLKLQNTIISAILNASEKALSDDEYVQSYQLDFASTIKKCCTDEEEYIPRAKGMPTLADLVRDLMKLCGNQVDYRPKALAMVLSLIGVVIRNNEKLYRQYKKTDWYKICNDIRHGELSLDNRKLDLIAQPIIEEFKHMVNQNSFRMPY
jgi:hypothetical protein